MTSTRERHRIYDCVIVGGGPAGLTAALYLGRFRRSVLLIDAKAGRARLIPRTRNLPGFPEGLSGVDFLSLLEQQVAPYDIEIVEGTVTGVKPIGALFRLHTTELSAWGRTVLFATGSRDIRPELDDHDGAVRDGLLRYCPICDGYEVAGKRVGLLVAAHQAETKARFLRQFTDQLDIQPVEAGQTIRLEQEPGRIFLAGAKAEWDTVYAELGSVPQSALASDCGIELTAEGCMRVRSHQETNVAGIYAAGDVVPGLDQITVAVAQAAVAATHIHNLLLEAPLQN